MPSDPISEEYQRALDALSSLISGHVRKDGTRWAHAFDMMATYLERLGLDKELPRLSVIHVAGTKGKGSTCAMIESILRAAGYRTGLYTSPHLIDVRERIRIDGKPVDKETFLRLLWETLEVLKEKANDDAGKPAYFRFLTLLCFKIFLEKNVDVAILEVGLGGRLDATNCVKTPVVCGVTALGFDHMGVLGYTLPEIAREKAGIFKPECPAFTVPQREDAFETLRSVAHHVGAPLSVVQDFDSYIFGLNAEKAAEEAIRGGTLLAPKDIASLSAKTLSLGLAGAHQRQNAALAVRLAAEWEGRANIYAKDSSRTSSALLRAEKIRRGVLPKEYVTGLQFVRWPGRSQVLQDPVIESEALQYDLSISNSLRKAKSLNSKESTATMVESVDSKDLEHYNSEEEDGAGDVGSTDEYVAVVRPRLTYFLDGAHTAESMETCALWFSSQVIGRPDKDERVDGDLQSTPLGETKKSIHVATNISRHNVRSARSTQTSVGADNSTHDGDASVENESVAEERILLFNCMQEREPLSLLQPLAATLASRYTMPHHALFVPPDSVYSKVGAPTVSPAPDSKIDGNSAASVLRHGSLSRDSSSNDTCDDGRKPESTRSASHYEPHTGMDLSWQLSARKVWERVVQEYKMPEPSVQLPQLPREALPGKVSSGGVAQTAVLPSLSSTLEWLRKCARERPRVRFHVLVTGSLYMVGDTLRLLGVQDKT